MKYKCLECGNIEPTRDRARKHAKEKHRIKGRPPAAPMDQKKYAPSEISASYERVR